jgi:hypothetical protein
MPISAHFANLINEFSANFRQPLQSADDPAWKTGNCANFASIASNWRRHLSPIWTQFPAISFGRKSLNVQRFPTKNTFKMLSNDINAYRLPVFEKLPRNPSPDRKATISLVSHPNVNTLIGTNRTLSQTAQLVGKIIIL